MNILGILVLAWGVTGCNIGENLTFFLPADYRGPICLDLGFFKGSLKVRVTHGDLEYRFRTGDRKRLLHHAVEFLPDASQNALEINIRGELDSGQLNPNAYYAPCIHYAESNWQIYAPDDFFRSRLLWIRAIAAIVGIGSLSGLISQIKHLLNILSAEDYKLTDLLKDVQQNRKNIYVKVSGKVYAENPINSPWKNVPCVYFSKRVTQTYQPSGKKPKETKTLEHQSKRIPFQLQDDSASIEVLSNGAIIRADSVYRETKPASPGEIETTEAVLSINSQILVVGMAKYQRDRPILTKPDFTLKQKEFKIYQEDAIELEKGIRSAIRIAFIFLVLSSTFGLPFLIPDIPDPAIVIYELTKDF
ncbi:MAG: hypothetical protein J7647_31410 [Cyanobacteria bacterium SBLK]|nr:hypothetical protein [Cyanobacteria bacterium SBLK]